MSIPPRRRANKKAQEPPPAPTETLVIPPGLTRFGWGLPDGRILTSWVRPEDVSLWAAALTALERAALAPAPRKRQGAPRGVERFKRGLYLLTLMRRGTESERLDANGRVPDDDGELTKELVNDIKRHCKDWPEVRKFKSQESFRLTLKRLAEETREAQKKGLYPPGWGARI